MIRPTNKWPLLVNGLGLLFDRLAHWQITVTYCHFVPGSELACQGKPLAQSATNLLRRFIDSNIICNFPYSVL